MLLKHITCNPFDNEARKDYLNVLALSVHLKKDITITIGY